MLYVLWGSCNNFFIRNTKKKKRRRQLVDKHDDHPLTLVQQFCTEMKLGNGVMPFFR